MTPDITPQAHPSVVPSKPGHQQEPVISRRWMSPHQRAAKESGSRHSTEGNPTRDPTWDQRSVFQSRVDMGTETLLFEAALEPPSGKHVSCPSSLHTNYACHPQFSLYHPVETPRWVSFPHTKHEEEAHGDAHDLPGLGPGDCRAGFPSPQSWAGRICTEFELAYLKRLLLLFFFLQIKYLWQEIGLDIPETSKGLGTYCPTSLWQVTGVSVWRKTLYI